MGHAEKIAEIEAELAKVNKRREELTREVLQYANAWLMMVRAHVDPEGQEHGCKICLENLDRAREGILAVLDEKPENVNLH